MSFQRGSVLPQNYKILQKRRKKITIVTLKVHDTIRERLNMSNDFQCTKTKTKRRNIFKTDYHCKLIIALRRYVTLLRNVEWINEKLNSLSVLWQLGQVKLSFFVQHCQFHSTVRQI